MSIYKDLTEELLWAGHEIRALEEEVAFLTDRLEHREKQVSALKFITKFKQISARWTESRII